MGHMRTRGSGSAPIVPEPSPPHDQVSADGVEERGAFAFARCDSCGWQGPGRRSRERARTDLQHHLDDRPEHADHVGVAVGGEVGGATAPAEC